MGTIIEFPADAASRRLGSTMDTAPRQGCATILILPAVRIERHTTKPAAAAGPKKAPLRAAADAAGAPDRTFSCRIRFSDPALTDPIFRRRPDVAAARHRARRLRRRRFRPHPRRIPSMTTCTAGWAARRPAASACTPSQFQLTDNERAVARSRLSADRAAAFAAGLEERVRRLQGDRPRHGGRRRCSIAPPMAGS